MIRANANSIVGKITQQLLTAAQRELSRIYSRLRVRVSQ